jgi:hypothetical protein
MVQRKITSFFILFNNISLISGILFVLCSVVLAYLAATNQRELTIPENIRSNIPKIGVIGFCLIIGMNLFSFFLNSLYPTYFHDNTRWCLEMNRSSYYYKTETIRGLIADKNPDTKREFEDLIDNCKPDLDPASSSYTCYSYCNSCTDAINNLLSNAYKSVQKNNYIIAQFYLLMSDLYLLFNWNCFSCRCPDCLNNPDACPPLTVYIGLAPLRSPHLSNTILVTNN